MSAIFDDKAVRAHLSRAARIKDAPDFLWQHLGRALGDRLRDIRRDFAEALEISPRDSVSSPKIKNKTHLAAVPQSVWPLEENSLDALLSLGHLHWENDPVGSLIQFNRALRPDGLFLGALFGGESLFELREVIAEAEMELLGGVSPRVSPFSLLPDMAALMQRAQFALPVVDSEKISVTYGDLAALIADLRGMGQTHAAAKRDRRIVPRGFWPLVEKIYRDRFAENGRLRATVEIFYLTGWRADASQPKPLKPGSATARLSDALGAVEIGSGDFAKN